MPFLQLCAFPEIKALLLSPPEERLDCRTFLKLLKVNFAPLGSSRRGAEDYAYKMFTKYCRLAQGMIHWLCYCVGVCIEFVFRSNPRG